MGDIIGIIVLNFANVNIDLLIENIDQSREY
jgi:hypothetical protein